MRGRRLAAAVLHLVVGGFFALPDADASPNGSDDTDDVVVDVFIAQPDDGTNGDADIGTTPHASRGGAAAALAAAGVDLAVIDAGPLVASDRAAAAAESLVRDALAACRTAGTLKVIIRPTGLPLARLNEIAHPLGFRFGGVRPDGSAQFYRDLYSRRS